MGKPVHGLAGRGPTLRWGRLHFIVLTRPFSLPIAVAAVIVGGLALWYGADVSKALSILLPDGVAPPNTIARFWGLLQVMGGVIILYGVVRIRSDAERTGWSVLIGAHLFYAAGLIGGLGLAGSAAGTYMVALAVGSVLRVLGLKTVVGPKDPA